MIGLNEIEWNCHICDRVSKEAPGLSLAETKYKICVDCVKWSLDKLRNLKIGILMKELNPNNCRMLPRALYDLCIKNALSEAGIREYIEKGGKLYDE